MNRAFLIEAHGLGAAREHVAVMGVVIVRVRLLWLLGSCRRRQPRSSCSYGEPHFEIDGSYPASGSADVEDLKIHSEPWNRSRVKAGSPPLAAHSISTARYGTNLCQVCIPA